MHHFCDAFVRQVRVRVPRTGMSSCHPGRKSDRNNTLTHQKSAFQLIQCLSGTFRVPENGRHSDESVAETVPVPKNRSLFFETILATGVTLLVSLYKTRKKGGPIADLAVPRYTFPSNHQNPRQDTLMPLLGVNIDHVATVRQARRTYEPDPVHAAVLAEQGGADGITVHLREDRRHIQDRDIRVLSEMLRVGMNFEMAVEQEITDIACEVLPKQATLVPEKREEVTTEGGLDVSGQKERIHQCIEQLKEKQISVSLFIDPDEEQITASAELGVDAVELHTGAYADATDDATQQQELARLIRTSKYVLDAGLTLNMGHGLTYRNVTPVAQIAGVHELNIGHSIISHAVMVGLERAVREMKQLINA